MFRFILASSSPRRKELLSLLNIKFKVIPANIDEDPLPKEKPLQNVKRLAKEKSLAIAKNNPNCIVIGADTIVTYRNFIFSKPSSKKEAKFMLKTLSGKTHRVVSCYSINLLNKKISINRKSTAKVTFRKISNKEIDDYINTGDPLDKAGSYSFQGGGTKFVESVSGSTNAIIGLDIVMLLYDLKKFKLI